VITNTIRTRSYFMISEMLFELLMHF